MLVKLIWGPHHQACSWAQRPASDFDSAKKIGKHDSYTMKLSWYNVPLDRSQKAVKKTHASEAAEKWERFFRNWHQFENTSATRTQNNPTAAAYQVMSQILVTCHASQSQPRLKNYPLQVYFFSRNRSPDSVWYAWFLRSLRMSNSLLQAT